MTHNAFSGIEIRPYLAADRNACLKIFRSNLPEYFDPLELSEFEEFLEIANGEYFVATNQEVVIACGGCYVRDGIGRLSWGMVSRTKHHGRVGTALLGWRINNLFSNPDISEIGIDTSQRAAGFFARHGFRTTKTIADGFGVGIDQVFMSLLRADWPQTA